MLCTHLLVTFLFAYLLHPLAESAGLQASCPVIAYVGLEQTYESGQLVLSGAGVLNLVQDPTTLQGSVNPTPAIAWSGADAQQAAASAWSLGGFS